MTFLTIYLALISASALLSVTLLILAGVDHGNSSFYLMLLTPSLAIIHHAVIVFIPTYMEQQFTGSKAAHMLPTHATITYIAVLGVLSALWTLSTLFTFYAVGMNIAKKSPHTNESTGSAECVLGVFETGVSWVMFALCVNERVSRSHNGVPIGEGPWVSFTPSFTNQKV